MRPHLDIAGTENEPQEKFGEKNEELDVVVVLLVQVQMLHLDPVRVLRGKMRQELRERDTRLLHIAWNERRPYSPSPPQLGSIEADEALRDEDVQRVESPLHGDVAEVGCTFQRELNGIPARVTRRWKKRETCSLRRPRVWTEELRNPREGMGREAEKWEESKVLASRHS